MSNVVSIPANASLKLSKIWIMTSMPINAIVTSADASFFRIDHFPVIDADQSAVR